VLFIYDYNIHDLYDNVRNFEVYVIKNSFDVCARHFSSNSNLFYRPLWSRMREEREIALWSVGFTADIETSRSKRSCCVRI
jgi:hypothetical protein